MPTITLPPDPAANCYIDVAAADTYHDERLHNSEWSAATVDDRARALLMATDRLEGLDWLGEKTDVLADNALRWPRSGVYTADGELLDANQIPKFLSEATAELALEMLKVTGSELTLDEIKVGPITLDINNRDKPSSFELPTSVSRLISAYKVDSFGAKLIRA